MLGETRPATPADLPGIRALLETVDLPLAGLEQASLWVFEDETGRVLACAGLEVHGDAGLLRSLAVAPDARARGLGERLVRHVISAAAAGSLASLSLLTLSAPAYFPRFGFRPVPWSALPADSSASAELRGACPASASALLLALSPVQNA
jgi:amino-acid N-acetyltransferase